MGGFKMEEQNQANATDQAVEQLGGQKEQMQEQAQQDKMFTQEDLNGIVAKEAKKAQEKLLKQLGVEDFNSAKEGLTKLKEFQDAQKTEAEKQAEQLKQLEESYNNTSSENESLKAQLSALKAGVQSESIDDVVVLAKTLVSDDVDMDAAIAQVIQKYPHFAQQQVEEEPKKPSFTQGKHEKQEQSELDKWLSAFN